MEAFSITSTLSTTAASPSGLAAGTPASADAPAAGQGFGGIFNSLQPGMPPGAGRQDLAALLAGTGLPVPQLVSQPLGEAMAVITADSPMPGQDSLLAFARSQGLDETAIAALWQTPAPGAAAAPALPAAALTALPMPTSPTSLNLPGLAAPADGALPAGLATPLALGALPPVAGLAPAPAAAAMATTPPAQPAAAPTAPTPPVLVMGLLVQAQGLAPNQEAAAQPAPEPDALALQQLRASLMPVGLRPAARAQTPAAPEAPVTTTPTLPRQAQEVPTLTLDLQNDLTELARLPETGAGAAAEVPAPATSSAVSGVTPSAAGAAPASAAPSPAANAGAPHAVISGYQLKAEHYQQLADRMGQALAQRLQEQINSGQWSLKLRLNPAELGQVDVQLDMHAGGLDARFQTDNPLTKDLILQGSGRLKDSLSQHGTTVASVWVNSDDRRQSGGNPTPQQQQRRSASATVPGNAEPVSEAPAPRSARPDGWDMLA